MKKSTTQRGFSKIEFKDRYNQECSVQKSSIATEDCIWLGVDNPDPKVMACKAHLFGVKTEETTGWVSYPIPEEVLIHTRMSINKKQAKELIEILQKFVDTGGL